MTYYVLFLIDLESRRVHFAGATPTPDDSFMAQVARNLTDTVDGYGAETKGAVLKERIRSLHLADKAKVIHPWFRLSGRKP